MKKFNIDSISKKIIREAEVDFLKKLQLENIKQRIYDLILSGVTPVAKIDRKFKAYSPSYRAYLKGDVKFYTFNGRVVPVSPSPDGKITWKNPSKVNLFFYGDMLNSLYQKVSGNRLVIGFSDEKAKYHNDLGAGKSKVIRRLLPNKKGEEFTPTIALLIKRVGDKAIRETMKKNKTFLKVEIKIKR